MSDNKNDTKKSFDSIKKYGYNYRQKYDRKEKKMNEVNLFAPKKGGRPSKKPSIYEFGMMRQAMSISQLAEHYQVSNRTIVRWQQEFREELENEKGGQQCDRPRN